MPKGNLYPRLRKEGRLKMKNCKLPFKKLGDERIKPRGHRELRLIKKTQISEKESKHKIGKIEENLSNVAHWKLINTEQYGNERKMKLTYQEWKETAL